jgi:hypothetical protein
MAFSKESRMKYANATKLHRKSGGTWGTRPVPMGFSWSTDSDIQVAIEEPNNPLPLA